MGDQNDFDFEDDFLSDDNEPFDFDEEEGFPSGLGDEFESEMPEIEEEPEERGPNRTFVFLAGILIILFIAALAVVLFLATRTNGPTDLELTASQVVMLNMTVQAQMAQTSTQNAADFHLTQTAAAWTATPSDTPPPSATQPAATLPPSPTLNETDLALQAVGANALTAAALAARATVTPTPTLLVPPTEAPTQAPTELPTAAAQSAQLDLASAFATQLAFATQQGQFDQDSFSTSVAFATQSAGNSSGNTQAELDLRNALDATQSALNVQSAAAQTAIAFIDNDLATRAVENQGLATQLALVIPAGLQTQAALGTPFAQATVAAVQTQAALGTLSADLNRTPGAYEALPPVDAKDQASETRSEQATQVAMLPAGQDSNATATAAVLETRASFATQAAQATRSSIATQAAFATQMSFATPPMFATQAGIATQVALATRQALINQALGIGGTPTATSGGLAAVNQTATAIAGAFLTATAQAFTPGAVTITAAPQAVATRLPQTGIFDDVVNGGRDQIGVLAVAVFGLVGVIVVSRRLRSNGNRALKQEPPKQK